MSKRSFEEAVAVVTGASSGIGEAIVQRLAREGLKIAIVARRADRLEALAAQVSNGGAEILPLVADLTVEAEREGMLRAVKAAWGAPDVLVNNAGFGWYGYTRDMPWHVARDMIDTNVAAVVHLTLLALPDMLEQDSGHIINIGSVAGSLPSQGISLYSASKAFLDAFDSSLHRELTHTQVHVSTLRPGAVRGTEFYSSAEVRPAGGRIPAERFGVTADAVAAKVWSLLQRPRPSAYVPGILGAVPVIDLLFGWLIDRLGPLLLRQRASRAP